MAGSDGPYFFFLNPKASFQVADNLYLGGNILYLNSVRYSNDLGGLASFNGTVTYGSSNIYAIYSYGLRFLGEKTSFDTAPFFLIFFLISSG